MGENSCGLDFCNKKILAPMVRVCNLPMRLLALDYGADIVYSEEIVDRRILPCTRIINDVLHTVDFGVPEERYPVFRTCDRERGKVIFQMGTCDAEKAVQVARLVENDVAAVDVNMGCPKSFSLLGGMGAALLTQPEKVKSILSALVDAMRIPVTCKIRVLPKLEDTLALVSLIEKCGVSALTVHGRTKDERPRHDNRNDVIRDISRALSIPVIANGGSNEIQRYSDIEMFRQNTGTSSVMIARTAMRNASIFSPDGLKPVDDVIKEYLTYAIKYDECPQMAKYTVQQMLQDRQTTTEIGRDFLSAPPTLRDLCKVWSLGDVYDAESQRQMDRKARGERTRNANGARVFDDGLEVFELDVPFIRKHFGNHTPKSLLHDWIQQNGLVQPVYETRQRLPDKRYSSILNLDGVRFRSTSWETSKKYSEQAAALVATIFLKISLPEKCLQEVSPVQLQLAKSAVFEFKKRDRREN